MSITHILRQFIDQWLEGKEKRSLSMLARRSKVSYSTLRRIMEGETSSSAETALKIADVIMTDSEFRSFTAEYLPGLAKTRGAIAYRPGDSETLEVLNDVSLAPILLLASHAEGTNAAEVQKYFGKEIARKFSELVDQGFFSLTPSGRWRLTKDIGSVNLETARSWLAAFSRMCLTENDELSKASQAYVGWESVDRGTAEAIYAAAVRFAETVNGLVRDPANRGDVLVFYGSLFNVLKGQEAYR